MVAPILIALGGVFLVGAAVGYAVACARVRQDVDRLRARYRTLVNDLAQVEAQLPRDARPLRLVRGTNP